jgi:hypothetical protein
MGSGAGGATARAPCSRASGFGAGPRILDAKSLGGAATVRLIAFPPARTPLVPLPADLDLHEVAEGGYRSSRRSGRFLREERLEVLCGRGREAPDGPDRRTA